MKTVSWIRPGAFILENVKTITNEPHKEKLLAALSVLRGYVWKILVLDSFDYGVPQRRARVYIVGLRNDLFEGRAEVLLQDIASDMAHVKHRSSSWPTFLEDSTMMRKSCTLVLRVCVRLAWPCYLHTHTHQECKLPFTRDHGDHGDAEDCETCGLRSDCPKHRCKCSKCQKKGSAAMKCRWRVTTRAFLKRHAVPSHHGFLVQHVSW